MHHLSKSFFGWNPLAILDSKRRSKSFKVRWVLPGQLAVGQSLRKGDDGVLAAARITTILSLCAEKEAILPPSVCRHFQCVRYVLPDSHSSQKLTQADVLAVLKIIHDNIMRHQSIYVHCLAGMERSPTICLAYLCLYQGYNLEESLTWLKTVNPRTMPNEQQLNVVRSLVQAHSNFLPKLPVAKNSWAVDG